ncbi:MAG TPA: FAD-dependent monooxygenase [Bryobacteraceae bacterium]|nr:FAD-dependent monooxygenase [Bryobacteraceae bacterium]
MEVCPETEVFVIGGGPAGLAAAIAAKQAGFDVVVADAATPGHDKACGEGMMPDGIAAARSLGIDLMGLEAYPIAGIRFHSAGASVTADFPDGMGLGIRRTTLHAAFARHAERVGVHLLWGAHVTGISAGAVEVSGRVVKTRFIVGADGIHSRVRAWAHLEATRNDRQRIGFRRHFAVAPWSRYLEMHWANRGQLYITPVNEREVGVALLTRDRGTRLEQALEWFPEVQRRLTGAAPASSERGGVTRSRTLKAVARGRIALVGDASGSVDAITGQGICLAMQQSIALADAIAADDLRMYQKAHVRLMRRPQFMSSLMLLLDGRPRLQQMAIAAMKAWPQCFEALLAYHVGAFALTSARRGEPRSVTWPAKSALLSNALPPCIPHLQPAAPIATAQYPPETPD